jgi:hypothetical protein
MYCGIPERPVTTRWRRLGSRALACLDGAREVVGALLAVDAIRCLFTPEASILGVLVRLPGGVAIQTPVGLVLGAALLVRHRACAAVTGAFALLALANVVEFYMLRAAGLAAALPPLSLAVLAFFAAATARVFHDGRTAPWPWRAAGAVAAGPALVLLHLFSFGATDYTRPAEAIVVFGAGVYPDGTPSLALEDRVNHGIRLHQDRVAPVLVMSGGPDEVPVMVRMALEAGVPESAIVADPAGLNTFATLTNLRQRRVVAVSHYYHLARIKFMAGRLGLRCATAPCRMTRRLAREPYCIARECAALAVYYLFRG